MRLTVEAGETALSGDFDVILMDCQMPVIDGFEATRRIREAEAAEPATETSIDHRGLTANAIKGDRELCVESGMDGYVTDPIDPPELFRPFFRWSPRDRRRPSKFSGAQTDGVAHSRPASEPRAKTATETAGGVAPVDVKSLKDRCMGNRKLAAKTLNRFGELVAQDINGLMAGARRR